MRAVILSVGDELVLGQTVDTNSAWLSDQLVRRGIMTLYHKTVADDQGAIAAAIAQAAKDAPLVIVTGGLGPTEDDLTRDALAQAMGLPLELDETSLREIEGFFTKRGRPMPQRNCTQAMRPRGSDMLPNTCGTAPGIRARLGNATIYVTPGVPSEMLAMCRLSIFPEIDAMVAKLPASRAILATTVHTFGAGESTVAEWLGPLMARDRNPTVGTTVSRGLVSVRIRSEFEPERAKQELERTVAEVESRVGPIAFGRDDATLQQALVKLLRQKQMTLATAESCTGGMLGQMITDVPGSSAVYLGGWVTYANAMKARELGVPEPMLAQHGAVSAPVARAMAVGAVQQSGADLAASITGIAGPDGGTPEKPVGMVLVGMAFKAELGRPAQVFRLDLPGERDAIRDRAAKSVLQLLRFWLMDVPLERFTWARPVE